MSWLSKAVHTLSPITWLDYNKPGTPITRDAEAHKEDLANQVVADVVSAQQTQKSEQIMLLGLGAGAILLLFMLPGGRR